MSLELVLPDPKQSIAVMAGVRPEDAAAHQALGLCSSCGPAPTIQPLLKSDTGWTWGIVEPRFLDTSALPIEIYLDAEVSFEHG